MDTLIPLLAGLGGAIIGAAASIVGVVIQARSQSRRDRTKEAIALALQDWKFRSEVIKERGGSILPLAVFVHYHTRLIELAEKRELTAQAIKALSAEQDQLIQAIADVNNEWLKQAREKRGASQETPPN